MRATRHSHRRRPQAVLHTFSDAHAIRTVVQTQMLPLTFHGKVIRRLKANWHRWRFSLVARQARRLAPLQPVGLPFVLLSMVHTRDVDAYLVAVHSFCRHVPAQRVVTVCDPSITPQDRDTLRAAIAHIELVDAADFRHPDLPVGGCWERLQAMAHFARQAYVVQLDADTVANGPLPHVVAAIRAERPFIIGEEAHQTRVSHMQACEKARPWQVAAPVHVQGLCEFVLPRAQLAGPWYVRGCAGFFGMPRSPDVLAQVLAFSAEMRRLTGPRWTEWGTEQVTVNYITAQHPQCEVLPWPAYATPEPGQPEPVFAHFIGSIRFTSSHYRRAASAALHAAFDQGQARQPAVRSLHG